MRLLVTRPEPDGERTAAELRSRGHRVVAIPLMRIEGIATADLGLGPWAATVFTSANAVKAITGHSRFDEISGLPAYVVGAHTRSTATAAGFTTVRSADGNVEDLVRLIVAQPGGGDQPLLYLAGRERRADLAQELRRYGKVVNTVVIYRTVAATDAVPQIRRVVEDGAIDAVLHYSARTAAAFVAAAAAAGVLGLSLRIKHLCLSSEIASTLTAAGAETVQIAGSPNEKALFQLLES